MKRIKRFALYALLLIIFFVFSRVIIFIGLNNTYNNIDLIESVPQGVTITSAKATSVNGEIKGKISDELKDKFIKFNFYTDNNALGGSYYLTPSELQNGNFEFYFKMNYIDSYSIELTDEKPDIVDLESFSIKPYEGYIIWSALFALMLI